MKSEFEYLNEVKMDFSCYEQAEKEKEFDFMKRNKNSKKIAILAACIAVFTLTTALASGFVGNIVKSISTGYNKFVQVDPDAPTELMDELKGKIFDADGNMLTSLKRSDIGNIYDKDGNKITGEMYAKMIEEATGNMVKVSGDEDIKVSEYIFESLEKAKEAANFELKLPAFMPEGYELAKIYAFKGDGEKPGGDYMNFVYKNKDGKEITFFERLLNEETAFEAGTDGEIKEMTVNGQKGVIMNGESLYFETRDNVSVGIATHGNVSEKTLIKIAESVE